MSHELSLRKALILCAALAVATACAGPDSQPEQPAVAQQLPPMENLVTTEWLSEHLDDPDLVVLDCSVTMVQDEDGGLRTVSGRASYNAGHIPSAGFADLMGDLSDTDNPNNFALPTPERFAEVMGALGVGDDSRVVLYDSSNSAWAARVWWMLRWVGFDRAALLDGGLRAWTAEDRPLSIEPASQPRRQLTLALRPELISDRDEVLAAIENDSVHVIDAMPAPHYRGEMVMYDRPGHIVGATNVPVTGLLDESGHFRPLDELAAMHDGDLDARTITYCGGGIAASENAFVMTRLGYTDVAVYIASLQEWAADPTLPMMVETPE